MAYCVAICTLNPCEVHLDNPLRSKNRRRKDMILVDRKIFDELRRLLRNCNSFEEFLQRCKWSTWFKYDPKDREKYENDYQLLKDFFGQRSTKYEAFRESVVDNMKVFQDPFIVDSLEIMKAQNTIGLMSEPLVCQDISCIYEQLLHNNNWKPIPEIPAKIKEKVEEYLPKRYEWLKVLALCQESPKYTTKVLEEMEWYEGSGKVAGKRLFPTIEKIKVYEKGKMVEKDKTVWLQCGRYAIIVERGEIKTLYIF